MKKQGGQKSQKGSAVPNSVSKLDGQLRADSLLEILLLSLGVALNLPDEEIVVQDDEFHSGMTAFYFVNTGSCRVKVRDHNGRDITLKTLNEGDHFGEIALIYQTRRTATVISCNYNTLARMQYNRYLEVISDFPEYETCLKDYVLKTYNDKKI